MKNLFCVGPNCRASSTAADVGKGKGDSRVLYLRHCVRLNFTGRQHLRSAIETRHEKRAIHTPFKATRRTEICAGPLKKLGRTSETF